MTSSDFLRACRGKWKSGARAEALGILEGTLRNGAAPSDFEAAGRFLEKRWEDAGLVAPRVHLLGQCTTTWLKHSLMGVALAQRLPLHVTEAEFDSVIQELAALEGARTPDAVVLLPWHQRLLSPTPQRSAEARTGDELNFWRNAWTAVKRTGAKLVQVGYDTERPGPLGYHLGLDDGPRKLVRVLNEALRNELPADAYFLDLEQVAGDFGRSRFYDPRRYHWTKQPFSEDGCFVLARHVFAGLRAALTGPKKVLVLDLDNTLWGGVVGEVGPLGIEIGESPDGEAFRAFQRYVKDLAARGIVLAAASKNNPADAREPFTENPNMVLALDDFATFQASWDRKSLVLSRMSETLALPLDSFVFFDDNPAEREEVRQALPEVTVVDVPPDPAEYIRALELGLHFESLALTNEDRERTRQYRAESTRREEQAAFASVDDYLRSLEMVADTRAIDAADMSRVVQLLGKTNQFNLTTRRHSAEDVRRLLQNDRSVGFTLRLRDRFGDHGLVAIVLGQPDAGDASALLVDTWLMSCRVIGRTLEEYTANLLLERARSLGYARIRGEYIPTAKNHLVSGLFERIGYRRAGGDESAQRFELTVADASPMITFVVGVSAKES